MPSIWPNELCFVVSLEANYDTSSLDPFIPFFASSKNNEMQQLTLNLGRNNGRNAFVAAKAEENIMKI